MTMKHYLFLLAWVDGSASAAGVKTKVKNTTDLRVQFDDDNENIFALVINAANDDIASAFGYKEAFFENYYAHDSISVVHELTDEEYENLFLKNTNLTPINIGVK
jgi:hypothetical protein